MERKPYSELTIIDNFMFTEVFRDETLMTELLRRVLPEEEIGRQKIVIKEMTVSPVYLKRGVRFDVYSEDGTHLFDVEMQAGIQENLFDRAIVNLSNLIVHSKNPSEPFQLKGKFFVIFFCAYDETKTGRLMEHYTFKNENGTDDMEQAHIIIVNCPVKAEDHPSIRPFADYVTDGTNTMDDPFVREVESAVQLKKKDREAEDRYMNYEYELYCAKKEGIEEGRKEGRKKGIRDGESIGMIRIYDAFLEIGMNEEESAAKTAGAFRKTIPEVLQAVAERESILPESDS